MVVTRLRHAATIFGLAAVIIGAVAAALADGGLATRDSTVIGWPQIELQLSRFNRLGGLVTAGLGALTLMAARRSSPALLAIAGAGFAGMAADVVIQWGRGANLFGGSGHTLALWTGLAAGLVTIAWALSVTTTNR